jgi:large subunit ribosomal protein L18
VKTAREHRLLRHRRVRRRVSGTGERPRLVVFRSNKHIYVQLVDDMEGKTVASASTTEPTLRGEVAGTSVGAAQRVGTLVAQRAVEKGVTSAVFDRAGFSFHGRVKALADAAREAGLKF